MKKNRNYINSNSVEHRKNSTTAVAFYPN